MNNSEPMSFAAFAHEVVGDPKFAAALLPWQAEILAKLERLSVPGARLYLVNPRRRRIATPVWKSLPK